MAKESKSGVPAGLLRVLLVASAFLVTPSASSQPPYQRAEWSHWIDADRDCQNTRAEVLLRDAAPGTVTFRDGRECTVGTGEWTDPYTGMIFTQAGELDVEHLVPLKNAHDSGGWGWTLERRREYANELSYRFHLLAVSQSVNRSKGAKGPDEWRPPRQEFWCQYAQAWAAVKHIWELESTLAERQALREMLATC